MGSVALTGDLALEEVAAEREWYLRWEGMAFALGGFAGIFSSGGETRAISVC